MTPLVDKQTLEMAGLALYVPGLLLLIWQAPKALRALRGVAFRDGPELIFLPLIAGGFLVLSQFIALAPVDMEQVGDLGSRSWLIVSVFDGAVKLLLCVLIVVILKARPLRWASATGADAGLIQPPAPNDDPDAQPKRLSIGAALLVGLIGALIAYPVCDAVLYASQWIYNVVMQKTPPIHDVLEAIRQGRLSYEKFALMAVLAVGVAAVAEELFFRGLLQDALCVIVKRPWPAIVLTAMAFGAVHGQPQDVPPLIVLGVLLGVIRVRYHSILACITAHALFNGRTMLFVFLNPLVLEAPPPPDPTATEPPLACVVDGVRLGWSGHIRAAVSGPDERALQKVGDEIAIGGLEMIRPVGVPDSR